MRIKLDIAKMMVVLYEEYKESEKDETINKPMAYTLYHLWKYVDSIEKSRREQKNGNE